jgi:hypothetical protein
MKRLALAFLHKTRFVVWPLFALSAAFAIAAACRTSEPYAGAVIVDSDATDSSGSAATLSAHKLGANLIEAGVDSGSVPDGGTYLTWLLSTPVTLPLGDAPITGVELRAASLDLVNGTVTFHVATVGGDVNKVRIVTTSLTANQEQTFTTAAKNAVASGLNVTFQ